MRKLLLLLIAAMTATGGIAAQSKKADSVMDNLSHKIAAMKSIDVAYTITTSAGTSAGTMIMAGDCFHVNSDEIKAWYDGKTQWSYSSDTNEVNIIEPTPEELVAVNPLLIIKGFRKSYNASMLKSPAGTVAIKLTPKKARSAGVAEATVVITQATMLPSAISLKLDGGENVTIKIKSIKSDANYPKSKFVFNKSILPKAEIVDLR